MPSFSRREEIGCDIQTKEQGLGLWWLDLFVHEYVVGEINEYVVGEIKEKSSWKS